MVSAHLCTASGRFDASGCPERPQQTVPLLCTLLPEVQIERNGEIITTALGLPNHDQITAESFIGMLENADVEIGDWLINPNNERFYVKDKISDYAFHEFQQYRLLYLTEAQYHSKQSMHSVTTFNIQNAYGSVIGSQSSVVMNYNAAIQNAKKEIEASNSPDKEDLDKIISLLEMIVNNQLSPQKGLFSKFSSVMERNSWITGTITSTLLGWLTSQI